MLTGVSSSCIIRTLFFERYTCVLMQTSPAFPICFLKIYRCVAVSAGGAGGSSGGSCASPPPPIRVGTRVTDPRGHSTDYLLTATGVTRESIDALGQHTSFVRDARGQMVAMHDPLGRETRFEYDTAGNVTQITDPAGNVRRLEY